MQNSSSNHDGNSNSSSFESTIEAATSAALAARLERERKGKEKKLRKAIAKGQLSDVTMNRLVSELRTSSTDIYHLMNQASSSYPLSSNTNNNTVIPTRTVTIDDTTDSGNRIHNESVPSTVLSRIDSFSSVSSSASLIDLTFRDSFTGTVSVHNSTSLSSSTTIPTPSVPRLLLHPENIQHLLLWLLGGQMEKPNWINSKNKGLINNVVLLFIRDLPWSEVSSALFPGDDNTNQASHSIVSTPLLPFLSSLHVRKIKYPRVIWNPWYRVLHIMDHKILYLPKNAIVVEDNAKLKLTDSDDDDIDSESSAENDLRTGDKRKRDNHDRNSHTKKRKDHDDNEDEEDEDKTYSAYEPWNEQHLASKRRKRLFELSLSIHELLEHKFALALPKDDNDDNKSLLSSGTPPSTNDTTRSSANHTTSSTFSSQLHLSPGRIAGIPADICKQCTLHIPSGYILTRTAHHDLHNAYSDETLRNCPIFQYFQFIDTTDPLSGVTSSTVSNTTTSTTTISPHFNKTTGTISKSTKQQTTIVSTSSSSLSPTIVHASVPIFGIDCEMCETKNGRFQLARATVVDSPLTTVINDATSDRSTYMDVLFDELVKPEEPIHDYKTQYSGITKDIMDTAKYDIQYVQDKLANIFDGISNDDTVSVASTKNKRKDDTLERSITSSSSSSPTIVKLQPAFIVGHSIDNDLKSLRIIHTRIIDTSLVFPHPSGLPRRYSLRQLALLHLGRVIQDQATGHDSTEDAMTTLHLAHTLIEHEDDNSFDPDDNDEENDHDGTDNESVLDIDELLFSFFFHRPLRPGIELPSVTTNSTVDYYNKGLASTLRLLNPPSTTDTTTTNNNNNPLSSSSSSSQTIIEIDKYKPIINQRYAITDKNSNLATRHILGLPDMANKEKINSITVIGTPAFVSTNVCGSASGIPTGHNHYNTTNNRSHTGTAVVSVPPLLNNTVGETRRLTDVIVNQSDRIATSRKDGKYPFSSVSFTIAEVYCPTNPAMDDKGVQNSKTKKNSKVIHATVPTLSRLEALDQVLGGLCSKLAVGTAVVMVSQASRLRYGMQNTMNNTTGTTVVTVTEEKDEGIETDKNTKKKTKKNGSNVETGRMKKTEAAAAIDAQYGAVFLHVVNPPPSSLSSSSSVSKTGGGSKSLSSGPVHWKATD